MPPQSAAATCTTLIDQAVETLNDLIESCKDGERGFRACAENAKADDLRALLNRRAEECKAAAAELSAHVQRLGGEPAHASAATDAPPRGWLAMRGTLAAPTDLAMLEACERGEDAALERYADALNKPLEAAAKKVIEKQRIGTKRNHDQIRAMRDRLRAAEG